MARPLLLQTLAAVSWGTTLIGAFTGYDSNTSTFSACDERIWLCALGAAIVTSLAVAQRRAADRGARLYAATTQAVVSRPPYAGPPSGPIGLVPMPAQHEQRARRSR